MKVGLNQVDGKWSNIALMKLSAWHKAQGDAVEWFAPLFGPYDLVYASKIFKETPDNPYLPSNTIRGGTGYDIKGMLPVEVEAMRPDYSIYPQNNYAIGFTTRGCCRACEFCLVPAKEGKFKVVGDIYSFWNGQKNIVLLDNNLTAAPRSHFAGIMEQCRAEKLQVDLSQGLDLRLLTDDHCEAMKGVKFSKQIHFAWDSIGEEPTVWRGLKTYAAHFKPYTAMVYVLIGYNSTQEQDIYRVEKLRESGFDPFIMPYNKTDPYQRRFARWVNHKAIFKSVKWEDYKQRRQHGSGEYVQPRPED